MTAGRINTSLNKHWNTPLKYAVCVEQFFNYELELDPCSNEESIIISKNKFILPINGLQEDWNYKSIFINPHYGRDKERKTTIKNWIKKAYETHQKYNSEILMLIPVATNTTHWKEYVFGKSSICFLFDTRLIFRTNGNEKNKGCPMACAMIYYGINKNKFNEIFINYGHIAS